MTKWTDELFIIDIFAESNNNIVAAERLLLLLAAVNGIEPATFNL